MTFALDGKTIFVTGHNGMVGSAIVRRLARDGIPSVTAGRGDVDLRDQGSVRNFMERVRPDVVVIAAAKVGGIHANNTYPADFIYENLMIESNIIEAAHRADVAKLLFLGSSCIYPRLAPQPINEDALLTGPLEPTNEWYALAKIAGIKLCQAYRRQHGRDFIACQPTNLYGPNDNFNLATSHVLPALLRKAHEAREAGADSMSVLGHRHAAPRVPARRRHGGCLRLSAAPLQRRGSAERRAGARTCRSARWRTSSGTPSASGARSSSTPRSPTARRASSWIPVASMPWAGAPRSPCARA